MINYKHLITFVTVVRKKSFTLAAKDLYMTQPAISWQIKNLENELELILIERKERGTKLTDAGKRFYLYAEKVIKAYDQLLDEMQQIKSMEKGCILIGASSLPGQYIIPSFLSNFKEYYPASDIHVSTFPSQTIVEKLLDQEIQIGFVGYKVEDERIISRDIGEDNLVCVVTDIHPLGHLGKVSVADLVKYPLVIREKESGSRKSMDKYFEYLEENKVKHKYEIELTGCQAVLTAVKSSTAVAWVSIETARDAIKAGTLLALDVVDMKINRRIYLIYHALKTLSPLSESFIQFVLKGIKEKNGEFSKKLLEEKVI